MNIGSPEHLKAVNKYGAVYALLSQDYIFPRQHRQKPFIIEETGTKNISHIHIRMQTI